MDRKIVTVALLTVTTCAALSGFYYDNGVDQTVVHKQLTKRERKEMQSEILHLLGLQHRPHPSFALEHRKAQEAEKVMSNSAPRFLIDVYQSLTEEDSGDLKLKPDLIEREFNVSDKDVNSMDEADVIMSFINRGQHLHGIRHHHSDGRFWFDLSEVPNLTTVIAAELRLFINQSMKIEEEAQLMHVDSEFEEDEDSLMHQMKANNPEDYALTLYEIGIEDSLTYVDRVEVDSNQEGWVAFNVTMALRNWLYKPEENFGLQLVCRHAATGRQISAREVGMVGSHGNQKLQPFMVAFFRSQSRPTSSAAAASVTAEASQSDSGLQLENEDDEEDEEIPRSIGRFRRQAGNNRKRSKEPEESGPWNPYADFNAHYARRSCQKKNLYVSFRDLGWQDWIIAPDGYAAFYCNGECSFPLNAHMNASNHAIVQTLVHLMNPYRVPKPCCAPIKLSSISVLYFDDNSNVILKKYRNMVVKSCGCH